MMMQIEEVLDRLEEQVTSWGHEEDCLPVQATAVLAW